MQKFYWLISVLILSVLTSMSACDETSEPDHNLTFKVNPLVNGQSFKLNTDYISPENQRFKYEKFAFYLSKVKLIKSDGTEHQISEVLWYNLGNPETVKIMLPEGDYTALQFSIGLDEIMNASDPATFAEEHPLSYSQNNYWTWASKYIFAKLEGRCDNNPDGESYESAFSYHLGLDTLYREKAVSRNINISNSEIVNLDLKVNVEKIFENIDIVTDKQTHSTSNFELAEQIMNNFMDAIE
ncbi:MAG: hypothetical protein IPM47_11920 [Sphingobacteriales bacterium]|nr:MAG: hypothetical protein IPM47_11920 [Sphingobacteriales bacterium]